MALQAVDNNNRATGRSGCIAQSITGWLLTLVTLLPPAGVAAESALVLGVFPRQNPQTTTRMFTPLAEQLTRQLGRPIRLEVSKDYESFWEAVSDQRYDIVHYNQYHYIRSHKEAGYQVILKNQEFGDDTLASALIARKDSGIQSLADLRGKKVVFGGGPTAMVSYIMNTHLLRQAGLKEGDYTVDYAVSPPNAAFGVYYGHAAAAGTGDIVLNLPIVKKQIKPEELTFLARSPRLPHIPWAVKGNMPPELRQTVQATLAGLKDSPAGQKILAQAGFTALIPARDEEYDEHRRITWAVLRENYCVRDCAQFTAGATAADERTPLTMSIFPRREKRQTEKMFKPLADYLARELKREVRLVTHKTFDELWRGIKDKRYDIVHVNQFQYIRSRKLYGYDVILKNEEFGVDTITPAIFVRKDSGITRLEQLKGKRVIFGGGKLAMVSYVGNLQLLRQAGLKDDDYQWSFAVTPPNGCHAMYLGQADACGAATVLLQLPSFRNLVDVSQMKILAQNMPLANVNWAVKDSMNPDLRRRIQGLLADLHTSEEGKSILKGAGITALPSATDTDYNPHRKIVLDVLGERY